jgi:hypothetical protein
MFLACSGANKGFPSGVGTPDGAVTSDAAVTADVAEGDATLDGSMGAADAYDAAPVDVAPPDPCAGEVLCDDFESSPAGLAPNAALWSIPTIDCTGLGSLKVDDSDAHSGKHSVKVTNQFEGGAPSYCDHVFFGNSSAFSPARGLKDFYVRFFFKLSNMVGNGHSTFVTMTDRNHANEHVRVGFINQVFTWNLQPFSGADASFPDTYSPDNTSAGAALSASPPVMPTWQCMEFHIDGTTGALDAWVDDTEVPGMVEPSTTPNVGTAWPPGWTPDIADVNFGWETYDGIAMTIWFDDVAVATHRIGCSPADAGGD